MSESTTEDIILQIKKANVELKKKLEFVSKMRIECAQLQLELLKLYTPECLEIMDMLKDVAGTNNSSSNLQLPKQK